MGSNNRFYKKKYRFRNNKCFKFSNNNNLAFIDISPSYYSNKSNNNLKVDIRRFYYFT